MVTISFEFIFCYFVSHFIHSNSNLLAISFVSHFLFPSFQLRRSLSHVHTSLIFQVLIRCNYHIRQFRQSASIFVLGNTKSIYFCSWGWLFLGSIARLPQPNRNSRTATPSIKGSRAASHSHIWGGRAATLVQNTYKNFTKQFSYLDSTEKHFSNVNPIENNSQLYVISKTISTQNTKYSFQNH